MVLLIFCVFAIIITGAVVLVGSNFGPTAGIIVGVTLIVIFLIIVHEMAYYDSGLGGM